MNINATVDFPSGSRMVIVENFFDAGLAADINQLFDRDSTQWEAVEQFSHYPGRLVCALSDPVRDRIDAYAQSVTAEISAAVGQQVSFQNHSLWLDMPGYKILPHVDSAHNPDVAVQVYMGQTNQVWEMLGFCIYTHSQKALFEMHYRPNAGYIFSRPNQELHGLNHSIPEPYRRKSVYLRYQLQ